MKTALRLTVCALIGIGVGVLVPVQPFSLIISGGLAFAFMIITR